MRNGRSMAENISDDDILEAMTNYGGSFVRQLAKLFRLADDGNRRRLLATFPEYWDRYAELVRLRRERPSGRSEAV